MTGDETKLASDMIPILRQPCWLCVGAGALSGAMLSGAGLGAVALLAGLIISPFALGAAAGFFLLALLVGFGLSRDSQYSIATVASLSLSFGHMILLGGLAWVYFYQDQALNILQPIVGKSIFNLFDVEGNFFLTFGPLFMVAMIVYTVLAPLSLIIFRYIAFRK